MDFIIPGIEINIDAFLKTNTARVSLRKKGSDTEFLHPNNIGFGITYVLPIIVSGLIAQKGCMMIVENPEAHLHPSGQSRIGQFLGRIAGSGIQVVVETHSEHVINGVRLATLKKSISPKKVSILYFSQDTRAGTPKVEPINVTIDNDLTKWPAGFFDQEQRDLAEIIKNRKGN